MSFLSSLYNAFPTRSPAFLKQDGAAQIANNGIFPTPTSTKSYWRSEPHEIDVHRSTEDLPSECDVIIIGTGMSGVTTAYHLTRNIREGAHIPSVVLLEARQVCSGATGRNGGHSKLQVSTMAGLLTKHEKNIAFELFDFFSRQIQALKEIVIREKLECEFELRRSFDVWLEAVEAKEISQFWHGCVDAGHEWTKDYSFYDESSAANVTSMKGARAAFSMPACSLWPYKFVSQLLARLLERNLVNLQTNTMVKEVAMPREDRMNVVTTNRGVIRAKKVVFATNAYSAGLLPCYKDVIVPYLGTATHLVPSSPVLPHLTNTYNINYAPGARRDYMNPRPAGGIVIGGGKWTFAAETKKWFNVWDDSKIIDEVKPHFASIMRKNFGGWEKSGAKPSHLWTGIMGATADELPHVGEIPGSQGSQFILAGFNGGGMTMITLCAEGVATMVRDEVDFGQTSLPAVFKTTPERLKQSVGHPEETPTKS